MTVLRIIVGLATVVAGTIVVRDACDASNAGLLGLIMVALGVVLSAPEPRP